MRGVRQPGSGASRQLTPGEALSQAQQLQRGAKALLADAVAAAARAHELRPGSRKGNSGDGGGGRIAGDLAHGVAGVLQGLDEATRLKEGL